MLTVNEQWPMSDKKVPMLHSVAQYEKTYNSELFRQRTSKLPKKRRYRSVLRKSMSRMFVENLWKNFASPPFNAMLYMRASICLVKPPI